MPKPKKLQKPRRASNFSKKRSEKMEDQELRRASEWKISKRTQRNDMRSYLKAT